MPIKKFANEFKFSLFFGEYTQSDVKHIKKLAWVFFLLVENQIAPQLNG